MTELKVTDKRGPLDTKADAIKRGFIVEAEGGYSATELGVYRGAIEEVIQGFHSGKGYGRQVDFLARLLLRVDNELGGDDGA